MKWKKQISPLDIPKFVAGTTNALMETYEVEVVAETGWEIEATYLEGNKKDFLIDLSRWQDILQIEDKADNVNPLIMYPSSEENKNEIDIIFSYAIYSSGDLDYYPTDEVKGDITVTVPTANKEDTNLSFFTFEKQSFTILNAQDSSMFLYAFASSAALISTFASLV